MLRHCIAATLALIIAHGLTAQETPARAETAAMVAGLDALEPKSGWLGTPPGLEDFLWEFYQRQFRLEPRRNRPDETRHALGKLLFFDRRLSRDRTVSCADCHDPRTGFGDGRRTSIGVNGTVLSRNAPTLMNAGMQRRMFWDGRVRTLEEQARLPILNPAEMGMPNEAAVVARLAEVPEYVELFQLAYDRPIEFDDVARALATFQRSLVFLDAPFDRWRAGAADQVGEAAEKGFELFTQKNCTSCHPVGLRNPLFTDGNFHNTGIAADGDEYRQAARAAFRKILRARGNDRTLDDLAVVGPHGELGRALVSKQEYNVGAFRSTQLRNVGVTGPYMHDGSLSTLWDVVEHYNQGGVANPWLDPQIHALELTPEQVDQMVAFLFTLTDVRLSDQNRREFERQRADFARRKAKTQTRRP